MNTRIEKFNRISHVAYLISVAFFLPTITFAFAVNLQSLVADLLTTFGLLYPILTGIAFISFFYGIGKFILAAGNEKAIAEGKQFMIWSVIALFVLLSFWGILNFLSAQFGFGTVYHFPVLPTNGTVPATNSTIQYQ